MQTFDRSSPERVKIKKKDAPIICFATCICFSTVFHKVLYVWYQRLWLNGLLLDSAAVFLALHRLFVFLNPFLKTNTPWNCLTVMQPNLQGKFWREHNYFQVFKYIKIYMQLDDTTITTNWNLGKQLFCLKMISYQWVIWIRLRLGLV